MYYDPEEMEITMKVKELEDAFKHVEDTTIEMMESHLPRISKDIVRLADKTSGSRRRMPKAVLEASASTITELACEVVRVSSSRNIEGLNKAVKEFAGDDNNEDSEQVSEAREQLNGLLDNLLKDIKKGK